jgi:hypothetical protein
MPNYESDHPKGWSFSFMVIIDSIVMTKLLIIFHTALQLLAITSWIWLDYRVVAVLALLHLSMLEILRGCPLSHVQFPGDKGKRFYEWWFEKLGIQLVGKRRHHVRIFMQYILPGIIVIAAMFIQLGMGIRPLISL